MNDTEPCPCINCGFLAWETSAETGRVLYCWICDMRSRLRDALSEERRLRQQRDALAAALRELIACHAEGGFVQPDAAVLTAALAALAALKETP